MVSVEYSEAITETLDILKHTRKEDVDKISSRFIEFLNTNASKTYKSELDHTKKIKDMQLKSKTKAILAIIYIKFWCNDEEKEEFKRKLKENETQHENELRKKHNPNDIFKNRAIKREENVAENVAVVEYKESVFKKILNRIKSFLHIQI